MSSLSDRFREALDPAATMDRLGEPPDPWQRDLLDSQPHRALVLASRQVGKTSTLVALALHRLGYSPGARVAVLAPSERQSVELLARIRAGVAKAIPHVSATNYGRLRLELSNGSTCSAWPANPEALRGAVLDLLLIDEAAFVADDAVFVAVLPMLSVSGGDMVVASSAGGPAGWFFDTWTGDDSQWVRVKVPATQCPRLTPAELDNARRAMGADAFAVEYECHWGEGADSVFSREEVVRMLGREVADDDEHPRIVLPSMEELFS